PNTGVSRKPSPPWPVPSRRSSSSRPRKSPGRSCTWRRTSPPTCRGSSWSWTAGTRGRRHRHRGGPGRRHRWETAMTRRPEDQGQNLTAQEAAEYTEVYKKGCGLVNRHMALHDREPAPSPAREAELREGVRLLQRAVELQPRSWPAHWIIGKGYQALG